MVFENVYGLHIYEHENQDLRRFSKQFIMPTQHFSFNKL